jgi:hypothetical protein
MITIDVSAPRLMADHLEAVARAAPARARAFVRTRAQELQSIVRGRASGRPGPQVLTGRYVTSIGVRVNHSPTVARAEVGTDHPEGFRLERGFHGTDRLGRHFVDSPGHPHFGPAAAAAEPLILDAAVELIDGL